LQLGFARTAAAAADGRLKALPLKGAAAAAGLACCSFGHKPHMRELRSCGVAFHRGSSHLGRLPSAGAGAGSREESAAGCLACAAEWHSSEPRSERSDAPLDTEASPPPLGSDFLEE